MSATAVPAMTSSGQPVLILKEGASQTRGKEAQKNNIMAAKLIAEVLKTSLGPRGMDKMLVDGLGDVTITNDGATILKELDVQHPAAKMMVEISKATDSEVGDGTTSSVLLAGALLEKAELLINKNVHPTIIVDGYRKAAAQAIKTLEKISIKIAPNDKTWLQKIAETAMSTKLVSNNSEELGQIAVEACLQVAEKTIEGYKVDVDEIKVEKKPGGDLSDTVLYRGIVLDKEVVHSGMSKKVENAKIALIASPLEIEKPEFDTKLNITNPEQMKAFLDEENQLLKGMVDKVKSSGANVVLCQKGIDDVAQHYLTKYEILSVRRVKESDMDKLAKATGGRIVTSLDDLGVNDLGTAGLVEERPVEEDKWVFVEKCKNPKSVSVLIRGGTQRIVDEGERSFHDALMVVKDVIEKPAVVAGGGAPEAEVAHRLRDWSNKLAGREQLAVQRFADCMEGIPLALAENAGMDVIDAQVTIRARHGEGKKWDGVNVSEGKIEDMKTLGVFEPEIVKVQIITSATEAAGMILRIDDVIAGGKSAGPPPGGPPGGMPGGMDME